MGILMRLTNEGGDPPPGGASPSIPGSVAWLRHRKDLLHQRGITQFWLESAPHNPLASACVPLWRGCCYVVQAYGIVVRPIG